MNPEAPHGLSTSALLALVAAAGAAGTLCRYGLARAAQGWWDGSYPFGTTVVNLLGCLAFGFVWQVLEARGGWGVQARIVALGGFMGAFTTFSTFAHETADLLRRGEIATAIAAVAVQNVGGFACVALGWWLGQTR
jgi:CrcB protein